MLEPLGLGFDKMALSCLYGLAESLLAQQCKKKPILENDAFNHIFCSCNTIKLLDRERRFEGLQQLMRKKHRSQYSESSTFL